MSKFNRWLLVLIMCGVFGMTFLGVGVSMIIRGHKTDKWPTTTGKIIERTTSRNPGGPRGRSTSYSVSITYSYTVEDKSYTSGNIGQVGFQYKTKVEAQHAADSYPEEVTVYYNPINPDDCTIVKGTPWFTAVFLLVLGTLFFSIGIWGALKGATW